MVTNQYDRGGDRGGYSQVGVAPHTHGYTPDILHLPEEGEGEGEGEGGTLVLQQNELSGIIKLKFHEMSCSSISRKISQKKS